MTTGSDFAIDDVGLFDVAELAPALSALVLPNNLLPWQEAASSTFEVLDLHGRWRAERRDRGWDEIRKHGPDYVWGPTICGPQYDLDVDRCHPVILSTDLRCNEHEHREHCCCVGDLVYRHACVGCGVLDQPHDDENAAVEDAMDHAWPGWRDLPVLATSMPMDTKKTKAWLVAAIELYPAGWIEAGGPVRTARRRGGNRHVAGRTPHRGYDLGALVNEEAVAS